MIDVRVGKGQYFCSEAEGYSAEYWIRQILTHNITKLDGVFNDLDQKSFVLMRDRTQHERWHTFGGRFLTFSENLFGIPLYRELEPKEKAEWCVEITLLQINLDNYGKTVVEQIYSISGRGHDKQDFLNEALDEATRRWYQ